MNMRIVWCSVVAAVFCVTAAQKNQQVLPEELQVMNTVMKVFEKMPSLEGVKPLVSIDKIPYVSAEAYFEYFFAQKAKQWAVPFSMPTEPIDIGLEWVALFCMAEAYVVLDRVSGNVMSAKGCPPEERQKIVAGFIAKSVDNVKEHAEAILVQEQVESLIRQFGGIPEGVVDMKRVYTNQSGVTVPLFIMDVLCQQDLLKRIDAVIGRYQERSEDSNESILALANVLNAVVEMIQKEQTVAATHAAK